MINPLRAPDTEIRWTRRRFLGASLGGLLLPSLVACRSLDEPTSAPFGSPRLEARPGAPTQSPTLGRSDLDLEGGRDGFLYIPESLDTSAAVPLMMILHGATGSSTGWEAMIPRADADGFVLMVPESRDVTWDAIRTTFDRDVDYIDRALAKTFAQVSIDPMRSAIAGFSDGASYGLSLGVANGDLFSHIVGWSPGFMVPTQRVGKPPVFISHGTTDGILPVGQSRDRIVPSLRGSDYDVTYVEFAGGHTIPGEIIDQTLDWFLSA